MKRTALILAVLATAATATVLRDGRGGGAQTMTEPRASRAPARTQPQITRPARRILCPSPLYQPAEDPRSTASSLDARELLGLTVRAAERRAKRGDCSVRIVRRDGRDLIRTDDIVASRINVEVESGFVVNIEGVG